MDIRKDLLQQFTNFLIKNLKGKNTKSEIEVKSEIQEIADELHKPIYRRFKKM